MMRRPWAYRLAGRLGRLLAAPMAEDGWIRSVPPPFAGWTNHRDMPAPALKTFAEMWKDGI
jgi:hypothetical protein